MSAPFRDDMRAICTMATRSHLDFARCLVESFFRHHTTGVAYVLYLDDVAPGSGIAGERVRSLRPDDLGVSELAAMQARYNTFEFCNVLKPFLLAHVLAASECRKVCYFDSDVLICASLDDDVWNELDRCALLLTPHLVTVPEPDPDLVWRDLAVLQHGVYNGGFIGVRRSQEAEACLRWWGSRVVPCGYKKLDEGMNCDQRWLDLIPGLMPDVCISRHPGLNAGYWNLHERRFDHRDGRHFVNGERLGFFHFSGYALDHPDAITRHWTRFTLANRPDVRPLVAEYRHWLTQAATVPAVEAAHAQSAASEVPTPPAEEPRAVAAAPARGRGPSLAPRVTVVIPAFNAARHLGDAIESVLAQTIDELEIIVVDDGSTDDTREVLAAYRDSVRSVVQSHAGVSAARNHGVREARGALVAFLDADDTFLLTSKLDAQAACFDGQPEVAIVHSGWRVVDELGRAVVDKQPWHVAPHLDLREWLLFQPALPSAMMFRREALLAVGGFDCTLPQLEDVDLAIRLAFRGYRSAWLKQITARYRRHRDNASRDLAAQEDALATVLERFFTQPGVPEEIGRLEREVRYGTLVWMACQYHRAGRFGRMADCLLRSLRYAAQPTVGAVLDWIERFSATYTSDFGEPLSVFDLTELDEWRALVRSPLIGDTADQMFPGSPNARIPLDWVVPPGNASPVVRDRVAPPAGAAPAAPAKLNLRAALSRDYGRHRSGLLPGLQALRPLHHDEGVLVDAFPEHTFDRAAPIAAAPHREPWIGLLHNPPAMPPWFIHSQSPQSLLASGAFQESLRSCLGFFCFSTYHQRWLAEHLRVPVAPLLFPTEAVASQFSFGRFLANPDKKIVQIGSWLRKLHSIYSLPVTRLRRAIVHQHLPYIDALFAAERAEFRLDVDCSSVRVLDFLSAAQFDDLLSSNIVYLELYDASANNTIVECIVRHTPVLVNPLPAVREYLGDDYPFYFTSRRQAARKAENVDLIGATHEYLRSHPMNAKLTPTWFLASVAESDIYRSLPMPAPRVSL